MITTMKKIQTDFGGKSITELQLEDEFHQALPDQTAACHARLDQFFAQWFDTAYTAGGGANKPQITGPGLSGPGFFCAPTISYNLVPPAPTGSNGWYTGDVTLAWQVDNGLDTTTTTTGCVNQTFSTDGTFTASCAATNTIGSAGPVVVTVKRDATAPSTTVSLVPTPLGAWYSPRTVTLPASDATSGVASTSYRLDGGAWTTYTGSFFIASFGPHTLEYRSTDNAGNVEATKTISWGSDFSAPAQLAGLSDFVTSLRLEKGLTNSLNGHLDRAAQRLGKQKDACNELDLFVQDVLNEAGKDKPRLTYAQADQLLSVNQIETLLGCLARGSTRPDAEHQVLELMRTIDVLGLEKSVANDLGNRARHVAQQIATQDDKHACKEAADFSDKVADLKRKGKLTAAQAAVLDAEIGAIERDLGC